MGYRNYIAPLKKEEYNKIKNFTKKKLYEYKKIDMKDDCVSVYDIPEKAIYELGKYVEFGDEKFFKPVFKNKKLQKEMTEEYDFFIVGKDFLKHIIEHYAEKVKKIYTELLTEGVTNEQITFKEIPQEKALAWFNHIRGNSVEWLQLTPYNLDSGEEVTTSWKYEYSIFELVRIYKSFDWKNNLMIYYGY